AVGFHAPCNFIVEFDRDQLEIAPDAEVEDALGEDRPMTQADIETVLAAAYILPDGRMRASASLFLEGRPLGPWRYEGTRSDDPNDVIPHQERRELRGGRLLAAWLNHFDSREQNTLAMWVEEDGRNYVRHHYIDFGDCFGSRWEWDGITRRLGHSAYFDFPHVVADWLTFGAISRPWDEVEWSDRAPILGYYDSAHFEPEDWRPGYPNPAFLRMDDGDAAWMARIIAQISDDHLRAMLDESALSTPAHDAELYATLIGRRDRILDHYLPIRSPLSHFEVGDDGTTLCFTDLGVSSGTFDERTVTYESRAYYGTFDSIRWYRPEQVRPDDSGRSCVSLVYGDLGPAVNADLADDDISHYFIFDISVIREPGAEPIPPARLHFYSTTEGFVLVGVERPEGSEPPL
ncbi:MAG: hypothetical protein KC561_19455, partial [Myxococcales bacterium]|nr:hypothetical protein [Myxococcales bacterium]